MKHIEPKLKYIGIYLPAKLRARIGDKAMEDQRSISHMTRILIEQALDGDEPIKKNKKKGEK